jgi:hypothetical protein
MHSIQLNKSDHANKTAPKPSYLLRPTRRGRFFRAKAQKKIAPDGSAKQGFQTTGMPTVTEELAKQGFQTTCMPTVTDESAKAMESNTFRQLRQNRRVL